MNSLLTEVQEPARVEFAGKDWKVIGYAKNIELSNERNYEDVMMHSGYPYKVLTGEKYTVKFELVNVDNQLYTLFTGQALEPQPRATVEDVKGVLRGITRDS